MDSSPSRAGPGVEATPPAALDSERAGTAAGFRLSEKPGAGGQPDGEAVPPLAPGGPRRRRAAAASKRSAVTWLAILV